MYCYRFDHVQDSGGRLCKPKRSDGIGRLETACLPGDPLYFLWYIQNWKNCDPSDYDKPFQQLFQNPYTIDRGELLYCSASWVQDGYEYFLLLPDDALYNRVALCVKVGKKTERSSAGTYKRLRAQLT